MNTHLQTASTVLFIALLATGIYFEPIATLVVITFLFLYTAVYAEIKQTEDQKKNEKKTTRENN
jgi:hypothetical protein